MPDAKLLSLFAGAGGLDLGLEEAGFRTVAASELTNYACETLRSNRLIPTLTPEQFERWFDAQLSQKCYRGASEGEMLSQRARIRRGNSSAHRFLSQAHVLEGDIRALSSSEIAAAAQVRRGELVLIAGGPPCQPFSRSGKRESVETEDGRLFREFVRIVRDLAPRWFLFENVKGLVLTKTDVVRVRCSICGQVTTADFDVRLMSSEIAAPNCATCGSNETSFETETKPGGSLEIILHEFESIGYKCQAGVLNAADFGVPQIRERLFIVGSRDGEQFEWPETTNENISRLVNGQGSLFGPSKKAWVTMREALWTTEHPEFGVLDSKAVLWVKNVVRPHNEPVTWSLDRPAPTIGAHQGAKLAIAPIGVPDEQLLRQQWHTLGRRQGDTPPIEVVHAYLTDLDLLQLQTFPDYWYLHGTRMQRAFQVGNAVPVLLAKAVGSAIMRKCDFGFSSKSVEIEGEQVTW